MSSGRLKLMRQDVAAVIGTCRAIRNCPFQDFILEEHVFAITYIDPTGRSPPRQVTFNFSEDYPEQTVGTWTSEADNPRISDDRIQVLFNQIAEELNSDIRVPVMEGETEMETASSDGHPLVERTLSNTSHYSDCNSDITSDYDDYDDYYKDKDSEEEDLTMNALLQQEIEIVRNSYGEKSISHRLFGTIDDIDVELHIGMSFLDAEIAKAWKVIREEPIVVRLHLSLSRFLDATEPKIEVFQPSQKEKFGIGSQLRKILEQFVSETWKNITNDLVEAKLAKSARPRKVGTSINKKRFQTQVSSFFDTMTTKLRGIVSPNSETAGRPAEGSGADSAVGAADESIALITEMGFSVEMARNALIITHGNVEEALNLLLSSPDSVVCSSLLEDGHYRTHVDHTSPAPVPSVPPVPPPPLSAAKFGSRGNKPQEKKRAKAATGSGLSRQTSGGSDQSEGSASSSNIEDLNLLPSSTQSGINAKHVPDLDNGFLVQVMQYTRQRLPTLNEYCVVCDEQHVFQNGAMLKPAVCARELCVFGFQTLGVMSDAAEDIATGAEVVDLLMAMAVNACRCHRREVIFEPYPTIVDPTNQTELALNPKKKDYKRCEKAMEGFMEMKEMMSLVGSDLKKEMDAIDTLSYPLLQWIITSNRSHIVKLPPEKQISFMHTPHQFLLMSSPPAKEAVFRAARQQYGSTFAFHGSHIENWHCIMRMGLINATGTKHQMHGAAYGKGIYLSPHASVSFGYSGMGYGHFKAQKGNKVDGKSTTRFLNSKNLTCIALCEVITHKDLRKHGNIWVQPHADFCCTRFFFVYEDGQVGDSNIDTQVEKYKKEVMRAVGYQTR